MSKHYEVSPEGDVRLVRGTPTEGWSLVDVDPPSEEKAKLVTSDIDDEFERRGDKLYRKNHQR